MYRTSILNLGARICWIGALLYPVLSSIEPAFGSGISANNVLVLYNADDGPSGAGYQIAKYYQQARPGVHLAGLSGINYIFNGNDRSAISSSAYLGLIRPQVLGAISGISDSIDVIVTTKGLPLKIDAGPKPSSSTSLNWQRYSSLESELTRIDSINTTAKMGDQFIYSGFPDLDTTLGANPYYNTDGPFVRAGSDPVNGDIRLASRLDGYSVQTVKATIDRAQQAYIVPRPYGPMVVVDDDPTASVDQMTSEGLGPGPGLQSVLDTWQQAAEERLAQSLGQPDYEFPVPFDQFDGTDAAITSAPGKVIGYVSHGVHDGSGGLTSGYIENQFQFQLANGAIFQSHESYNANTFDPSYTQNQGLVAEWLEIGGTAGLGHVKEPYNGADNVANEDLLYQMMLPAADAAPGDSGLTFIEAAWNATRQLSYVNTVVGDPLMRYRMWLPGDANLDGKVNLDDLALLQVGWLKSGSLAQGDFNGDGFVNLDDFAVLQVNWLRQLGPDSAANQGGGGSGYPVLANPIPEPSAAILGLVGAFLLAAGFWRRSSRPQRHTAPSAVGQC